MSENKDYWKELLGDDYNEDLFKELIDSDPDQPAAPSMPAEPMKKDTTQPEPVRQEKTVRKPVSRKQPASAADDFQVDFDFDKAYKDVEVEDKPVTRKRERRSGCLSGILYAAFVICISLVLVAVIWISATDVLGLGKPDAVGEVTIPDEVVQNGIADIDRVAEILHDEGFVDHKILFKLYASFSSADEKIEAGTYKLNYNYDFRALVNGMTSDSGTFVEVDVTIPEGYTMTQIFQLLESNNVCTATELKDTATNYNFEYFFLDASTLGNEKRLEGYLFPDTYTFYENDDPENVLGKMLDNFGSKFDAEYQERAAEMGYSIAEIVNIASMIEKEAGSDDERATIASVMYNRLENWDAPYLQIDATINYIIEGTNREFSTEIDSLYNTYMYSGLPMGPISNPGMASIKAALYPEDTDYNYYALGLDGTHEFFEGFDAFSEFVNSDEYGG